MEAIPDMAAKIQEAFLEGYISGWNEGDIDVHESAENGGARGRAGDTAFLVAKCRIVSQEELSITNELKETAARLKLLTEDLSKVQRAVAKCS